MDLLRKINLIGEISFLKPLDIETDSISLFEVSNGSEIKIGIKNYPKYDSNDLIWKYMFHGPFSDKSDFRVYLEEILSMPNSLAFTILDKFSEKALGLICYILTEPENLKVQIGRFWLSPIAQGTGVCTEVCTLLIQHAFEMGYRRIDWKTWEINFRSQKAAQKLGFKKEFLITNDAICKGISANNFSFRILNHEWNNN